MVLKEGQANYEKPVDINIADLIAGKKVAIFAVPGAFTPGCSKSHLPSFITAQDELKAKGVEMTICIATNDAYVMEVGVLFSMIYYNFLGCILSGNGIRQAFFAPQFYHEVCWIVTNDLFS